MVRSRPKKTLSEATRRDITDWISGEHIAWAGRLDEVAFLNRLYDLGDMPSTDHRYRSADRDIWQHRINNPQDWPDDWVFDDPRFDLRHGPDEQFLDFLGAMLHPVVRPDPDEVRELAARLNSFLARDGWQLVPGDEMSGRPVFVGRRRGGIKTGATALSLERYRRLREPDAVRDHLRRIERGLADDPPAAIGSSKELVETTCKLILDDFDIKYRPRDDLVSLFKQTALALRIRPEDVPGDRRGAQAAQRTLRALVPLVQALAELRNELGLGHGRSGPSIAPARHARLAFNAATTVVEFLLDTWEVRRSETGSIGATPR